MPRVSSTVAWSLLQSLLSKRWYQTLEPRALALAKAAAAVAAVKVNFMVLCQFEMKELQVATLDNTMRQDGLPLR